MTIPAWADAEFTKSLGKLRGRGEGQHTEFKEDFPEQGHSLCTEVAAFASSGGGTILLGVANNGELAGLKGDTENLRDELIHRAQNLIALVQPHVDYQLHMGFGEGAILGIVIAEKQSEPVYYYKNVPYVRIGPMSRPGTPNEVKEFVWAHPSAECARRMEELNYERVKHFQDHMKRLDDNQVESMAAMERALLGPK